MRNDTGASGEFRINLPPDVLAEMRRLPSPASAGSHISVSTHPGATLLTVMSRFASSMQSDFTKEIIAPFDAA